MERFVDRKAELDILEREYRRPGAALVILYGRRRVGKTALCREFMRGKQALYFLATEESENQNREQFRRLAAEFLQNSLLANASVGQWDLIFQAIADTETGAKKLLIMDEFQYLGKGNPAFPSVFQRIWDNILSQSNIMVILCGSLIHMMEEQTLNYGSPLYGRRTAQIKLKQIPFRYYSGFYPGRSPKELSLLYSITGGVPKYAELFEAEEDIYTGIKRYVLNSSSFLFDEPNFLLQKEVSEIGSYFSVIKTIAMGNQKLSRIAGALEIKQTGLTRYLKTLMDLDILRREVPVTEKTPETSKKGLYRMQDNFLLFWFRFVYPNMGYLEAGQEELVLDKIRKNFIDSHVSYVYEDICREYLWQMGADGCWPFLFQRSGRWWNQKGEEIDVAAVDEESSSLLLGECKYWKGPVGSNVLEELERKSGLVEWRVGERKEYYVLFSLHGFTKGLREQAKRHKDVVLVEGVPIG